tara:strand:- start:27448 stop:27711 length:264 start_codon:yes stop_codon:yes gene_type:complete
MNILKAMGLVTIMGATGVTVVNLNAGSQDVSLIKQSTPIQYQAPDNATQIQKDCYKMRTEVSLAQFSAVNSKAEGHELAMKSCGIKP